MIHIINQYPCTSKVVKENLINKHNQQIRIVYSLWLVLMFVSVIRFASTHKLVWLLVTVVFIALMALTVRYKNNNILREWKRYKRNHPQGFPYIVIELGEVIAYTESNRTRIYSWRDFDHMAETEHLIIMIMKDGSRLVLKKNAFTAGSAKQCIRYLKKKRAKETVSIG